MTKLNEISKSIWGEDYSPSIERVEKVKEKFKQFDFMDILIFNFCEYRITSISEFLLATFKYWENWTFSDWTEVFDKIKGDKLSEYYMTISACTYLGINPNYDSAKNIELRQITFQDNKIHSGKPSTFIGESTGRLREIYQRKLLRFNLTIEKLIEVNDRLINQGGKNEIKDNNRISDLTL